MLRICMKNAIRIPKCADILYGMIKSLLPAAVLAGTVFLVSTQAWSQLPPQDLVRHSAPVSGSLEEIRGRRRAHLLVMRSNTVDASADPAQVAVDAVRSGMRTERRFRYTFAVIGKKLNKYIRDYQVISGVGDPTQADFVIVFNLLRYRRILNSIYPEGEMYVVSCNPPGPARVLWRTEKQMLAEDATSKLVKALKEVNGQR